MDTSHRGVFADVSATKPATFFPASFSPRPTAPLLLSPTLRRQAAEAGNEYAGGTAASFEALPKRIRNLQKKATLESAGVKLHAPQKDGLEATSSAPVAFDENSHRAIGTPRSGRAGPWMRASSRGEDETERETGEG